MAKERSIEVKVGILILVSLAVLVVFILVMGGLNIEKTYTVYVDFDNPGGLQSCAPVRIASVRVGKVRSLEFRGGEVDPQTKRRTLVRAELAIEQRVQKSIHENADFYVTTQGVLGEQFLAIEPGDSSRPVLASGAIVKGIDPPRLDLFLAKAYELLDISVNGIRNNKELISDIATNTAALIKGLGGAVKDNKDHINNIVANVDSMTAEANKLTHEAGNKYVHNPQIDRTIANVDRVSSQVAGNVDPMIKDGREALANLNRLSQVVSSPEDQAKIKKAIADVTELAARANSATADAQSIVTHIKKGKGTVGALVMDQQVYDDIQEMVRDVKHNPWKFLWRE
jgi:phospholipid/cholesterol/gamma-HCH transport system substrate-binding protein